VTLVTFAPISALITFVAEPAPELVIVPVLLTLVVVWRVITPAPVALRVRLPVPVIPPLKVRALAAGDSIRSWLLSVTAPLKMLAALEVMVATPVLPEATEIGLANVPTKPPLNVALALPLLSPIVIVPPVPNAKALVVPLTVPDLIIKPPVKVLAPERTNVPAPFLVIDPVLLIIPEMVNVPIPLPLLFTVKILVPERVAAPESVRP